MTAEELQVLRDEVAVASMEVGEARREMEETNANLRGMIGVVERAITRRQELWRG